LSGFRRDALRDWLIGEWLIGEWLIGEWLIGEWLIGICCGKQESVMSPLRKQGARAKKLDSRFRGNDKSCFRNGS